ncbi:hypothetical protein AB1Y20_017214 [Prymnesium parvum]|uniref:Galactose oxidase-like Early set domain-containing protein n=1 Tax=Prymnesium parvum TaxID=97485 RepID=A0AB34IB56_PRYPA
MLSTIELRIESKHPRVLLLGILGLVGLLLSSIAAVIWLAVTHNSHEHEAASTAPSDSDCIGHNPEPTRCGQWASIIPETDGAAIGQELGMQLVHAVLLPSGKVLLASGSSWRNLKNRTETFPEYNRPKGGTGLFDRQEDPFANQKLNAYHTAVNNVGIYNPSSNTFFRVPHPGPVANSEWPDHFKPSDLFCSGQIQLPNGNAFFFGGTQYYLPYRTGHDSSYIFDWVYEASVDWKSVDWTELSNSSLWTFSGFMRQGRWYPTAVPLLDGRMAIIGGFVGFSETEALLDDMYQFEINPGIEFFDYRRHNIGKVQEAWRFLNLSSLPNSPFSTTIPESQLTSAASECDGPNGQRRCAAYRHDAFQLYPRATLMPDGHRIFFPRHADWNSLRTSSAKYMRRTKYTYLLNISGTADTPSVSFQRGPDLPHLTRISGTVVRDPNTPDLLLVTGGMEIDGGTLGPGLLDASDPRADISNESTFDNTLANHYYGSLGSRGLLVYKMPESASDVGTWTQLDEDFLGSTKESSRTMHYMTILPTKQLLVVGGGNYDFAQGVRYPILYTPIKSSDGKFSGRYSRSRVADANAERLYHSSALLLPDGRVFVGGGNTARASLDESEPIGVRRGPGQLKFNYKRVDRLLYFFGDGFMGQRSLGQGQGSAPAEDWTAELYSPPYLFIDPGRRTQLTHMNLLSPPPSAHFSFSATIEAQTHYLLHSGLSIRVHVADMPTTCSLNDGSLVLLKLGASTHGWDCGQQLVDVSITSSGSDSFTFDVPNSKDLKLAPAFYHLFYVDCRGKPAALALSVRFDDGVDNVTSTAPAA